MTGSNRSTGFGDWLYEDISYSTAGKPLKVCEDCGCLHRYWWDCTKLRSYYTFYGNFK